MATKAQGHMRLVAAREGSAAMLRLWNARHIRWPVSNAASKKSPPVASNIAPEPQDEDTDAPTHNAAVAPSASEVDRRMRAAAGMRPFASNCNSNKPSRPWRFGKLN
jgi:hypothetical protein